MISVNILEHEVAAIMCVCTLSLINKYTQRIFVKILSSSVPKIIVFLLLPAKHYAIKTEIVIYLLPNFKHRNSVT